MLSLSVCMIVRNEEKYLARALDNLVGVVDEICILDTGEPRLKKNLEYYLQKAVM